MNRFELCRHDILRSRCGVCRPVSYTIPVGTESLPLPHRFEQRDDHHANARRELSEMTAENLMQELSKRTGYVPGTGSFSAHNAECTEKRVECMCAGCTNERASYTQF